MTDSILSRFPVGLGRTNGKVYLHRSSLDGSFAENSSEVEGYSRKYLAGVLGSRGFREIINKYDISLFYSIIWGNQQDKMIDFFGDVSIPNSENVETKSWIVKNGILVPSSNDGVANPTCGEGRIIFGREEEHRRSVKNIITHLKIFPEIPILGLKELRT